ncbi:MAG: hypothetical protein JWO19_5744 [Bryobacterales bacterium]|jgi:hypothetical protein|nr:hypothetical protein [Bryobacterales bacterium]
MTERDRFSLNHLWNENGMKITSTPQRQRRIWNMLGAFDSVTRVKQRCFWPLTLTLIFFFMIFGSAISAQGLKLGNGGNLINPGDLPPALAGSLQQMGGRMMVTDKAQIVLVGTITDGNGSRSAQITVQAPGYLSYREGQGRAVTFDGSKIQTKSGTPTSDDERTFDSLLADFPDSVFLQIATGGSLRPVGSHFRTDDGKSKNYSGPYWTVFAFSPPDRPGLVRGKALQQEVFIAIDEQTGLLSDVRRVVTSGPKQQNVTQTRFTNWNQQNGQWFPGTITRLENGNQVLSFQTQQAAIAPAADAATFKP